LRPAFERDQHELLMEQDCYRAQFWSAFDAFVQGAPLFLSEAKVGFVAYRDLDQIDLRDCPARGRSSLICVRYEQSNAWTFVVESS
jgi:hypothetical protein